LIFVRNNISGIIGLFTYIILMFIFYYTWTIGLDKERKDSYDMVIFTTSVSVGVFVWYYASRMIISKRLDNSISIIIPLLLIVWFTSCSYNICPNIY